MVKWTTLGFGIITFITVILASIYRISVGIVQGDYKNPHLSESKDLTLFAGLLITLGVGFLVLAGTTIVLRFYIIMLMVLIIMGYWWNKKIKLFIFKNIKSKIAELTDKKVGYCAVFLTIIAFAIACLTNFELVDIFFRIRAENNIFKEYIILCAMVTSVLLELYALIYWINISCFYTVTEVSFELNERIEGKNNLKGLLISQNKEYYILRIHHDESTQIVMIPKKAVKMITIINKPIF